MNILVTGSMGMIGNAFCHAAKAKGHKVLGIDKKAGLGLNQQPQLSQVIEKAMPNFDIIVHLAGTCSTTNSLLNPGQDFLDNTMAGFQVAEMARKKQKAVIYTSTCKVIPDAKGMKTPYGLTKYLTEEILQEYKHSFGIPFVINRPGTIYGPNQAASNTSGWLGWFIKAALEEEPLTIFGTGKQKRDVLYVDDYVALLMDQVENFGKYEGKVWNVGGGKENTVTLLEALEFLKYTNYNFGRARMGDVDEYVCDNVDVSAVNGWAPKVDWKKGITKVLDHLKAQELGKGEKPTV